MTTPRTLEPITIEVLYFDGCPVDPGAGQRDDYGLKCRIYRTATGLTGSPPDQWILDAIAANRAVHTSFPPRQEANRT
jgi:hypothetical protein